MKLFICWAGPLSHKIALVLRDWIPAIIPSITPWVSSEDIRKGTRWHAVVAKELTDSQFGLICIVPDNIREPWLLFEAGALSKSVEESHVFPLLFGVEPSQLPEPLAQFQATTFEKEDVRKLMQSLNNPYGQPSIPPEQLDRAFEYSWVGLQTKFDPLLKATSNSPVDTPKASPAPAPITDLPEEHVRILQMLASSGREGVAAESVSHALKVPQQKAQYYLDALLDRKYIRQLEPWSGYITYCLDRRGRAFLVEKKLL